MNAKPLHDPTLTWRRIGRSTLAAVRGDQTFELIFWAGTFALLTWEGARLASQNDVSPREAFAKLHAIRQAHAVANGAQREG
jgi:hypothetical protein